MAWERGARAVKDYLPEKGAAVVRSEVFVIALLVSGAANADIFKCRNDRGGVVFQEQPCLRGGEKIVIKAVTVGPPVEETKEQKAYETNLNNKGRILEVERELREQNSSIKNYKVQMDRDIAGLKQKKGNASNNYAGATWEQSISTEMQSVTQKYTSLIQIAQTKIAQLNEELIRLNKSQQP